MKEIILGFIQDGGQMMTIILLLDVLLVPLAVATIFAKDFKLQLFSLLFALLPLICGLVGFELAMAAADSVIAFAHPAEKESLYDASVEVARYPLLFGSTSTAILLLIIAPRLLFHTLHTRENS